MFTLDPKKHRRRPLHIKRNRFLCAGGHLSGRRFAIPPDCQRASQPASESGKDPRADRLQPTRTHCIHLSNLEGPTGRPSGPNQGSGQQGGRWREDEREGEGASARERRKRRTGETNQQKTKHSLTKSQMFAAGNWYRDQEHTLVFCVLSHSTRRVGPQPATC